MSILKRNRHYWSRYCKLIAYARKQKLSDEVYTEIHHIFPRSLGGSDSKANLVKLTARQHYLAHWLLSKSFVRDRPKEKMLHAFGFLGFSRKEYRLYNSKQFARAREAYILRMLGTKQTPKTRAKVSAKLRGRKLSPEHRHKMSLAKKGEKHPMFGKKHSDETIHKQSKVKSGKNNNRFDNTFYCFVHDSGFSVLCTRYDLIKEHKLDRGTMCKLLKGVIKSHKGWRVLR